MFSEKRKQKMKKAKQELQFIIDRICATWGIACYLVEKKEAVVLCRPQVEEMLALDKGSLESRCRERAEAISGVQRVCDNHALPVLLRDGKQVYYFAFLCEEELLFLAGPFIFDEISFEELHQFRRRHGISDKEYTVPVAELKTVLNCMVVTFYLLTAVAYAEDSRELARREMSSATVSVTDGKYSASARILAKA